MGGQPPLPNINIPSFAGSPACRWLRSRAKPHRLQCSQQPDSQACRPLLRLSAGWIRCGRGAETSAAVSGALFLHGLGDNEQTLFNTGGWTMLDDLRKQHKMGDFLIIAPEGRSSFYINSADGSARYNDFFLQELMPQMEHKFRIRPGRDARAVSGISMGGYGALRLGFAHPELFSAVSAQSAALITESPQELDAAGRSGAPLAGVLAAVFGKPINVPHWNDNSPFVLAKRNAAGLRKLAIISTAARMTTTASKKEQRFCTTNCRKKA